MKVSQLPRTVTSHVSRVSLIASEPRGPLPMTSPRLRIRVMPRASMSASTASSAVTLPWTSEMTATWSVRSCRAVVGSATRSVLVGRAGQREHPVEGDPGVGRHLRVDRDRVDDPALDEGLEAPMAKSIDIELEAFLPTLRSEDAAEGIQAFFGKREAQFKGR